MMKFFDKLFKRSTEPAPEPVKPERRSEADIAELQNLKLSKLHEKLNAYIGRDLTENEMASVKESLDNPQFTDRFKNAVGEDFVFLAKDLATSFGWSQHEPSMEEWEPGMEEFIPMKPLQKQIAFEAGLMEFLGRKPSANELTLARQEFIRGGEEARTRYSTMVGEDANLYGQEIAKKLGWKNVNESVTDQSGGGEKLKEAA